MRNWQGLGTLLLAVSAVWAADQPPTAPATTCASGVPGAPACLVSPRTQQEAARAFGHAWKLRRKKGLEKAYKKSEKAPTLFPQDFKYATLRKLTRHQRVYDHLHRGNAA